MMINVLNGSPLEFWGTGGAVRDFIHIDDVVEAMIASIFYEGPVRVFNVGSGIGRSINQVAADIESMFPNTIAHRVYREARARRRADERPGHQPDQTGNELVSRGRLAVRPEGYGRLADGFPGGPRGCSLIAGSGTRPSPFGCRKIE